jgi:hypothetical protein
MSSAASQTDSTVERDGVERLVPRSRTEGVRQVAGPALSPPPHPMGEVTGTPVQPLSPTTTPRPALADTAAIGALTAIAAILGTRLWLGLSILGAFWLAFLAIPEATPSKIALLVAYAALTVLPCAWLDWHKAR